MNEQTSILLVDDHAMLRKGLRALIEQEQCLIVSGEAADGGEAIEKVRELQPDIVVMDINMPTLNGIEATRRILAEAPETRILALSIHSGKRYVEEMLEAGVAGYLLKESAPEELIAALFALRDGKGYLSTDITEIVLSRVRESASAVAGRENSRSAPDKWRKPKLPVNLVHRSELISRLDSGRHRSLTLVVAPAGYGKSILVSDWLTRRLREHLWWSLTPEDNDLQSFLTGWIHLTTETFNDQTRYLPPLVEVANLPPVSILAGAMLAEMKECPRELIVILDNMHLLTNKSIHDLLSQVLKNPVDKMHFVMISRKDPFLPISVLRANNQLNELRTEDLRFSVDDVQTYLDNSLGSSVDIETASLWKERTEGWVNGLQLATYSLAGTDDSSSDKKMKPGIVDWRTVLTNREYEVLLLLNERLRDKEIADRLCVSAETVKSHLKNIYGKLQATDRRDAVVKAQQLNIL